MNPDFQEAIEMTRSGDKVGAQKKVAAILKEDPNNTHAWYLLSLLVDSDQKRVVYLSKVVSLDPNHEKAMEQLEMLQTTSTPPPHEIVQTNDNESLLDQAEASTAPDWMENFDAAIEETAVIEEPVNEANDVPSWVQEDLSPSWEEEENSDIVAVPTAKQPTPPPAKTAKKSSPPAKKKTTKKKKDAQQLNMILIGLVVLTVIVAFILMFLLFT